MAAPSCPWSCGEVGMSRAGGGGTRAPPGGDGTHLLQEIADASGILGTEDVPQGARAAAGIPEPLLQLRVHTVHIAFPEQDWGQRDAQGGFGVG